MHRIRVFIAGVFSVLVAMALVGLAAPGLAAAAGPRTHYGQAKIINTDRIVGFPQQTMMFGGQAARGNSGAPVIITGPANTTVAAGASASFSASASGTPTPTVQWQVVTSSALGSSWRAVNGATSTTYTFTASATESGYEYRAVFNNRFGSATTGVATLTVTTTAPSPSAPEITGQPSSETVAAGATASFSASASGTPTPTVYWQVSTNGGTTFSPFIPAVTSTTYTFTASIGESGNQYEAVFTNGIGNPVLVPTSEATLTVTAAPPSPPMESTNWSGYADSDATFSAVSASWIVPKVTCTRGENAYSAHWIGIDGYTSSTVEQDGTEADCINGSPSYDAWYEMYGDDAVNQGYEEELSTTTNPVSSGDSITSSVSVSGSTWTLSIWDTSRWTAAFTTSITFVGAAQSSAEWIVERPELCSGKGCSLTSLADFGSVTFSDATATTTGSGESISSYSDAAIEMIGPPNVLALPSALSAGGETFIDLWQSI
jgi:hypothetical protein